MNTSKHTYKGSCKIADWVVFSFAEVAKSSQLTIDRDAYSTEYNHAYRGRYTKQRDNLTISYQGYCVAEMDLLCTLNRDFKSYKKIKLSGIMIEIDRSHQDETTITITWEEFILQGKAEAARKAEEAAAAKEVQEKARREYLFNPPAGSIWKRECLSDSIIFEVTRVEKTDRNPRIFIKPLEIKGSLYKSKWEVGKESVLLDCISYPYLRSCSEIN